MSFMKRTRVLNNFLKYGCEGDRRVYYAQRNLCWRIPGDASEDGLLW